MIQYKQGNLKVHFAGLENESFARILHYGGGVKYGLFTVFPFIAPKAGIKPMKMGDCTHNTIVFLEEVMNHVIMDSGLFTLLFGAHAKKRTPEFIEKWYELYVEFAKNYTKTSTLVEIDCQKILGSDKAHKYRERLRKDLPNRRQINVFHLEDGQRGLDRIIEFSDYIALSVPELRVNKKSDYLIRLANYIKNKKPNIDIHLLGCTSSHILKELYFTTSSDSTSWQQVNRFGVLSYNHGSGTKRIKNSHIKEEVLKKNQKETINMFKAINIESNKKRLDYYTKYIIAAQLLKKQYTYYAGDQN